MEDPGLSATSRLSSVLRRAILAVMIFVILAALTLQAVYQSAGAVRNLFAYPDTSYPECAIVERALAVANGKTLYGDTRQWPYLVAMYGPLTYYPVALTVRAIGLGETREEQARRVYLVGRFISFAAGLAILLWLWTMAGAIGLTWIWRFLPILLFLSAPRMLEFWSSYRPDFPMVALALWAWAVLIRSRRSESPLIAALLMALAAFYKHTIILSAFALLIWLLVEKRRRDALKFACVLFVLIGVQSAMLAITTRGAWYANTLGALRCLLFPPALYSFLFLLSPQEVIPFAGGLAAVLRLPDNNQRVRPLRWAFVLTFCAAEIAIIRSGSNIYYYLETYCWGSVLATACIRSCLPSQSPSPRARAGALHPAWLLLLAIGVVPYAALGVRCWQGLPDQVRPPAPLARFNPPLARMLYATKGEILTMDGFLNFITQSPPTLMDRFLYSVRVAAGDLPAAPLIEKIRRKDFQLVILIWDINASLPTYEEIGFFPAEVVRAIGANYELAMHSRQYYVYTPAP